MKQREITVEVPRKNGYNKFRVVELCNRTSKTGNEKDKGQIRFFKGLLKNFEYLPHDAKKLCEIYILNSKPQKGETNL
jgi:hypothetical protein